MIKHELVKFLLVGGFSALVNIVTRVVSGLYFDYLTSIIIAFFVALSTAFVLNKFYVFQPSKYKNFMIEYVLFLLVNLFGLVQTVLISFLLKDYLFVWAKFNFHNETLAHTVGVVIPVFTSFIGHKYLSFKGVDSKHSGV